MWNIKKPCWIKCFLVCNHIFLLNLILSLSRTLLLLLVHDSFQLILPCFPFFIFLFFFLSLYFTFYLMDQSNHLFSYLLLFFGGEREGGGVGNMYSCILMAQIDLIYIYKWNVMSWNGESGYLITVSLFVTVIPKYQISIRMCFYKYIYPLNCYVLISCPFICLFFFFLLKQLFKFLLLFSILKFCYHSNKGASKMKRGKSYFDAWSLLESLIHNMT